VSRRRWILLSVGFVAALLLLGRIVAGWYVDYRWYDALGAGDVWWALATNLTLLRGGAFLVATLLVFANLFAVRHSVLSVVFPRRVGNIEIREEVSPKLLVGVVLGLSLLIGLVLALPFDEWTMLEVLRHGDVFRESDPHFERDLSFWLYWLPLEMNVHVWSLVALVAVTLIVVLLYALTPSIRWEGGRLRLSGYVRRHLLVLGAVFLLMLAWSYRIEAYRLLLQGSGPGGSFIALDHRVGMPSHLFLALITIVGAMLLAWSGWQGQMRVALATVAAVLVLSLAVRQVLPPLSMRLVTPTEAEARNRPYLNTRSTYTRRAFDIDRIATPEADERLNPTLRDVAAGTAIWDPPALARAVGAAPDGALGGKIAAPLGWQAADGRLRAAVVRQPIGPDAATLLAPWSTQVIALDRTTDEGGVAFGVSDPSRDRVTAALVSDSAFGYAVVTDSAGTIAGAALDRWGVRLAHAWSLQNPSLLSPAPGGAPGRAVLVRNLRARVRRLFPGFLHDSRTTPAVVGDSLYWLLHLYVGSGHYPLSERVDTPSGEARYFRHAALAVVNAHTGRVFAIPDSDPDPMTRGWMQRFPRLYVPSASIAKELAEQIPPPGDVALIQARILARFGRRGDVAPPSHLIGQHGGDTLFAFPAYTPFADRPSRNLGVSHAILDASDRLRGAYVAMGGAEFRPFFVELDSVGPRWSTVLDRLRGTTPNDANIPSPSAPLIRGPARVVPMGSSIVVHQTTYLWPPSGPPSVHHVAIHVGDSASSGRTLFQAAGITEPEDEEQPLTPEAFRARVEAFYAEMRRATARGDWIAFGTALDALGRLLRTPSLRQ
jgi:hypothetical protein